MDHRLLYFGFYKGEPISFFLSLPEMNQVFKHVNGKLNLIGILKFLWHKLMKTNRKAFGVLFGVVPAHQGKGADGAMVLASRKVLQDEYKQYDEYEMNWIGDFNPRMINVVEQVGGHVAKRHATYRKLFDESKPFKRSTILH
jgi:tryptophanase